jgi:hypothetical protein
MCLLDVIFKKKLFEPATPNYNVIKWHHPPHYVGCITWLTLRDFLCTLPQHNGQSLTIPQIYIMVSMLPFLYLFLVPLQGNTMDKSS